MASRSWCLLLITGAAPLIALTGCAAGTPAGPVTVGGAHARLVDADPCMGNGDSGCTDHSLGRNDHSLCLAGRAGVALEVGADVTGISASAGRRGDHQWVARSAPRGR